MALSERKKRILQAVVRDYIHSAEPVGSRTIARRYSLGLSPATIRNEMADLEESGTWSSPIRRPAASLPSRGTGFTWTPSWRRFPGQGRRGGHRKDPQERKEKDIDQFIQQISRVLSSVTNYTSLVLAP
jgi:heat-inducible transcriptional repressor